MKDLMIDIESLDTRPSAAVLSVGMMWFDRNNTSAVPQVAGYFVLDEQPQRTASFSTVKWWMQQSDEAKALFNFDYTVKPGQVAVDVGTAVNEAETVWANGPDFDCIILSNLLSEYLSDYKWPFWKNRCVRTVRNINREAADAIPFEGIPHNALDDCAHQIKMLHAVLNSVRA